MPRRRANLVAFKLLTMLLYGTYSYVTWRGCACSVQTAKLAPALGMTSTRLRQHCSWLERYGYLADLVIAHGRITFTLTTPPRYKLRTSA